MKPTNTLCTFPLTAKCHTLSASAFMIIALSSFAEFAQAKEDTINFHFSTEGEHDSSVGLKELDDFTREGDSAWVVKGGVKGNWKSEELFSSSTLSLHSHYEFTSRNYSTQNDYDQNMHHFSLNPKLNFGALKAGIRHDNVKVSLAGDDFMHYRVNALALEGSVTNNLYIRVAYDIAKKELQDYSDRNSDINGWNTNLFWFSDSGKHVLAFGTKVNQENARSDEFDFDGKQWSLRYTHKFSLRTLPAQLKLAHINSSRKYSTPILETNIARRDSKTSNEVSIEANFYKKLDVLAGIEWVNNNSNVASVDYAEQITSVGIRINL